MAEKRFPNNFVLAGVTALIYDIVLDILYTLPIGNSKPEYYGKIVDVGFEWKESSSSSWEHVSVAVQTDSTMDNIGYLKEMQNDNNYWFKQYKAYQNKYCIYPLKVLIKNLQKNTSYDLRSYYSLKDEHDNVTVYYYNQKTVRTLDSSGFNLVFSEPEYDETLPYDFETILSNYRIVENNVKEIFNMFYANIDRTYAVKFVDGNNSEMLDNTICLSCLALLSNDLIDCTGTMIHELGHDLLNSSVKGDEDEVVKFMEFATNAPNARWRWLVKHCYPIMTAEKYRYVDACLVVHAYYLTNNT